MAKRKRRSSDTISGGPSAASAAERRQWEVENALHIMQRASEIVADKKLLGEVKTRAKEKAKELRATATQVEQLAKMGRISPAAMKRAET